MKRATDDQYTLGRSFLQDAYLAVDYDQGNFSVYQALYPPLQDQIVPMNLIQDPDVHVHSQGGLRLGAIIGIVVGAALAGISLEKRPTKGILIVGCTLHRKVLFKVSSIDVWP